MSIRDEINRRIKEGRLHHLPPALPASPQLRTMFISTEVHELIFGPWESLELESRAGRLRQDFDMFSEGKLISVATDPYDKKKSAYMAPIDPARDKVWQIRSRDPKPGIRVFGHSIEKDMLVALIWERRENLGGPGSKEWRDERERCKAEWRKLFPTYQPFWKEDIHEIFSNIISV